MTTIYFIRHAQSDTKISDDFHRPLTLNGIAASKLLVQQLADVKIDMILSSPYQRAVETLIPLANKYKLTIKTIDDFRERKVTDGWIKDFVTYASRQWQDFDYCLTNGENLRQVQVRNINALAKVLKDYKNQTVVIGTHGTALSVIINYYDPKFGFQKFMDYIDVMPWIVLMTFEGNVLTSLDYSI